MAAEELPWPALNTKKRIGVLKNRFQAASKSFRDGDIDDYKTKGLMIYGLLRETWERAFEEILLGGVVERYRGSIQTMQAKHLSDITEEDLKTLEAGMSKTSRWLPGHDLAAAEGVSFPEADELESDIGEMEQWVKAIRSRRREK